MRAVIDHSITWRSKMARVLVVDDEKLIVKGIRFSLEQDVFSVILYCNTVFDLLESSFLDPGDLHDIFDLLKSPALFAVADDILRL